jgi:steroid delta-isomerase-like uncharacterized protein
MSTEENKVLSRRLLVEGFSEQNIAVVEELVAVDCQDHGTLPSRSPGLEGAKQLFTLIRTAFSDLHCIIEDQIAEGDMVVTRSTWNSTHRGEFLGIPATGKQVTVKGINIMRWVDGKIVEQWDTYDHLGLMQQLGVLPEMK